MLAAVDKFRGTATARQVAAAIGHACWEMGHDCVEQPIADGGEGTLEVLGGSNRITRVTNPLGAPVDAPWRFHRQTAIIEMAHASGLSLIGGASHNDVIAASTIGTGQIIDTALNLDAKRIIVCLGGSATIDGGLGAIRAIGSPARLRSIEFLAACDVRTRFVDAARLFGSQKGATPLQIELLTARLNSLRHTYLSDHGIDVQDIDGSGSAGGLAGGLAAIGATLVPGFDLVADEVGLHELVAAADLVITGEGFMDEETFQGKAVGGVNEIALEFDKPVIAICGDIHEAARSRMESVSLVELFGEEQAIGQPLHCIEHAAKQIMTRFAK